MFYPLSIFAFTISGIILSSAHSSLVLLPPSIETVKAFSDPIVAMSIEFPLSFPLPWLLVFFLMAFCYVLFCQPSLKLSVKSGNEHKLRVKKSALYSFLKFCYSSPTPNFVASPTFWPLFFSHGFYLVCLLPPPRHGIFFEILGKFLMRSAFT